MRKRKEKTEKTGGGQKRIGKRKATERGKKDYGNRKRTVTLEVERGEWERGKKRRKKGRK